MSWDVEGTTVHIYRKKQLPDLFSRVYGALDPVPPPVVQDERVRKMVAQAVDSTMHQDPTVLHRKGEQIRHALLLRLTAVE